MGFSIRASARRARTHMVSVLIVLALVLVADLALAAQVAAFSASSVSVPTVTLAPTAAVGARTGYTVVFTTSGTGGLSQAAGSTVTIAFPSDTKLTGLSAAILTDTNTAKAVGQANPSATLTLTFSLYTGAVVTAGDTLSASIQGATNPTSPGSTYKVAVSTTADTTAVNSSSYTIVAGHSVSTPAVTLAPTAAAGGRTGYTVAFNASSTGGMSAAAGSTVSVTFPSDTKENSLSSAILTDTTTAKVVGQANPSSTLIVTFTLYSLAVVNAGDHLSASINGAVNPTSPGTTYKLTVSTTSDTAPMTSGSYTVVAGHLVSTSTVTVAPTAAAGARSGYTVVFIASATGGLSQATGGSVTMTFPSDTKLNSLSTSVLTDTTTAKVVGQANPSASLTLTFFLYSLAVVNAGDNVSASIQGAVNPTSAGTAYKVAVSTSSDTTPVNSSSYSIVAGHPVSTPAVTPAPTAAVGARSGYSVAFNASTTGGMSQAAGGSVTVTFPSDTNLNSLSTSVLTDTTTAKVVGQANPSATLTLTFYLYSLAVVNAGDHLTASILGAVNPTSPGTTYTLTVSTSSDPTPVTSGSYTIVAGHSVSKPTVTPSDHTAAATGVTYTVGFKASTTGGMSQAVGSAVSFTFPAGTHLNTISSAILTDTTTAKAVGQANPSSTASLNFYLYTGAVVNPGNALSASIVGAVNPTTAGTSDTVTVSTTSEINPLASCPYYIGAGPSLPCVASVAPASGPAGGGTTVTISGVNFGGATSVLFGASPATGLVVNGAGTKITVTSPAGSGTVDVTVTTPAGTSSTGPSDRFKYVAPPKVTTTSLPGGNVSVAYSATLTAGSGKKPYTWSITGSLPPGLSLNATTGVISGTPTGTGTFTFTVKVTDSENPKVSATKGLSITIS